MRRFKIILTLLLIGLAGYFGTKGPEFWSEEVEEDSPEQEEESHPNAATPSQEPAVEEVDSRFTRNADGTVTWNPSIQKSSELHLENAPERDLDLISQIFSAYRLVYRENPVGTENFEFIAPLLGENPKKVIFLPRNHPALKGQTLHDRWGTPYHFHPLSGQKLDVRSAGPDRQLWTQDDLSLFPQDKQGN